MKIHYFAAAALFSLACFTAQAEDMAAFLKTFEEKRAGVHALKADFTQNTILPDELLETPGTLVFVHPRRIIMRTEHPNLTMLIDDRRAYEYDPGVKQLTAYDLDDTPQAEIFFLGFESDLKRLGEVYDLGFFDTGQQIVPSTGLSITPKDGDRAEAYFVEVRLYLDNEHLLPHKIHIINEDSEVITLIKRCTINPEIAENETRISLAPGTFVIKNDEMVETVGEEGKMIPGAVAVKPGERKTLNYSEKPLYVDELPPVVESAP